MADVKSRRDEAVDATRAALVDSALELFASRGFAGTSLDEVARAARVTKGALYHHFPGGKQQLFEAVFEAVDRRLAERVIAVVPDGATDWALVEAGVGAYLEACRDPVVRRIMFQEGPVALGWDRYRELDGCAARQLLEDSLAGLVSSGAIGPQPMALLSQLVFSILGEAGHVVATADDAESAKAEATALLLALLRGLEAPRDRRDP